VERPTGLLLLVTPSKKQVRVSLRLADGGGTPTSPEQLDCELVFDVAIAMRSRTAPPGKMPEVTTKVTPSQRSSLFHTAVAFQDIVYEMSENKELRRNRYEPGHPRCGFRWANGRFISS